MRGTVLGLSKSNRQAQVDDTTSMRIGSSSSFTNNDTTTKRNAFSVPPE